MHLPWLSEFQVKPYFNAAINNFEFRKFQDREEDFEGNNLPGVPSSTVNVGLDANYKGFSFYSNLLAVGEIPLNDENSKFTDPYRVVNLRLNYNLELLRDFTIVFSGGINNAFEEHYAASVLPNAVGFGGAAPRYYYPGNNRNYFGGVGLNYSF
ncbi:hypothetical protein LZ575_21195 [Antarcticibacterium sp. 1MA-6-2]|uniref:TonB-dependent receptor domain-containing protein n=1 Tax=Antarcticibacterium sp. 1MA-6-2 TaxID=2908210 RepID=UPI001F24A1DD|nr:TonB-dependent receptor [Antarcticibacterium sp. 1MA-6-2]UJH91125.1 hypothetical protein LZ575_21195 [Antarcticibacterium sp. 1MA-6-2]